jgi:hypothetical protein
VDEVLTMKEIEERYAPDWVLIAEPEIDDKLEMVSGKVVFHSPDADEIYRKARELKLDQIAVRYRGNSLSTWCSPYEHPSLQPETGSNSN